MRFDISVYLKTREIKTAVHAHKILKEGLQSVLRIGSAHNKGGPPDINIVQISHFSNSFWIETLVYIHL